MLLPSGLSSPLQLSVSHFYHSVLYLSRSSRALTVPLISSPSEQVLLTVSEAADMPCFLLSAALPVEREIPAKFQAFLH